MKIIVLHEPNHGGRLETIELPEGVSFEIVEGKRLHRLRGSNGFEHFFTPEGYYDGWGGALSPTSSDEADDIVRALEEKRSYIEVAPRVT